MNFSMISEHTKFTRPYIYKYSRTKDEILLVILKEDFKSFISAFIHSFKINKLYSLHEITEIWTEKLLEHERFLSLYGILFTTIEKNVSLESLTEFKKEVVAAHQQLANFFIQFFPEASEESIATFIAAVLTLACGLYAMSNLSNIQLEAAKLSGSDITPPDFSQTYRACFYQQVYCLEHSIGICKDENC